MEENCEGCCDSKTGLYLDIALYAILIILLLMGWSLHNKVSDLDSDFNGFQASVANEIQYLGSQNDKSYAKLSLIETHINDPVTIREYARGACYANFYEGSETVVIEEASGAKEYRSLVWN